MYKCNSKAKTISKPSTDHGSNISNILKVSLALILIIALAFSAFTVNSSANEGASEIFHNITSKKIMLYPGGMPFGVRFNTRGLIVSAISDVQTSEGAKSPAADSGLKVGDIISLVNSKEVNTPEDLARIIETEKGTPLSLDIVRCGRQIKKSVTPEKSQQDGLYHLGIFVRCQCAGIGTVSYITPDSLEFAGLGHGVCDSASGSLIPFLSGKVTNVIISEVVKGKIGTPGELRGHLAKDSTGELFNNCYTGIYGKLDSMPKELFYSSPLPVAFENEIEEGKAEILCTTSSNKICKYEIVIESIDFKDVRNKNFSIRITDKKLISETGGIVQGMSGSPIIQNGQIIGALTHVLVDDPAMGYGIFIGNMLNK